MWTGSRKVSALSAGVKDPDITDIQPKKKGNRDFRSLKGPSKSGLTQKKKLEELRAGFEICG